MNRRIRPTAAPLKKVGVTLLRREGLVLQCDRCGARWTADTYPTGRLKKGYWQCPKGCNTQCCGEPSD